MGAKHLAPALRARLQKLQTCRQRMRTQWAVVVTFVLGLLGAAAAQNVTYRYDALEAAQLMS